MNDHDNTYDNSFSNSSSAQLDCGAVVEKLGDYLEGDLTPATCMAVDAHINKCVSCAAFLAGYKHVIAAAADLKEPEQPVAVDVQNRLREALNKRLGINLPFIA